MKTKPYNDLMRALRDASLYIDTHNTTSEILKHKIAVEYCERYDILEFGAVAYLLLTNSWNDTMELVKHHFEKNGDISI